jgi:hypothetical protein
MLFSKESLTNVIQEKLGEYFQAYDESSVSVSIKIHNNLIRLIFTYDLIDRIMERSDNTIRTGYTFIIFPMTF